MSRCAEIYTERFSKRWGASVVHGWTPDLSTPQLRRTCTRKATRQSNVPHCEWWWWPGKVSVTGTLVWARGASPSLWLQSSPSQCRSGEYIVKWLQPLGSYFAVPPSAAETAPSAPAVPAPPRHSAGPQAPWFDCFPRLFGHCFNRQHRGLSPR